VSEGGKKVDFGYRKVDERQKEEDVKEVFESVAKRYDLMNDVLSFGMHRAWKRTCLNLSGAAAGQKVLDIASGTCDMAIRYGAVVGPTGEVWATDINHEMIKEGVKRLKAVGCQAHVAICDCEALPFEDNYFDIAVVSFGLRNMTHKDKALAEMMRVVKPGGRVVVLEFSRCWKIVRPFYDLYSFKLMPWLGQKIAGDGESYRYLAESIRMHPDQPTLAGIMEKVGLDRVAWKNLTFGVCAVHIGLKP
jgi:ubiquinone/menaquinone biosynthesis methyltransferase ubiE